MQLVQNNTWKKNIYVALTKSFLLWSFTLAVCLLVVGFPIQVILATVGILATIVLQALLPSSAVLLVVSSIVALNLLIVFIGAAILTARGIHPQEVSWLHWLHGQDSSVNEPVYASCPLTCAIH
ncbi:MAG: hypothetical protein QNJ55_19390 [Xenococcus sp. MO_188.B8]|nr:hypothetical protein [Xenococcus sp. MO_188.B8]